jgi:hypothetical protein
LDRITEDHIEKFIRYPELLSEKEKEDIQKAITNSAELKRLAVWFQKFYDDLEELEQKHSSHTVHLRPLKNSGIQSQKDSALILAAKSPASKKRVPLETLVTYASEEQQIIVRLLRDNMSNHYRVHLLSGEDPTANEMHILTLNEHDIDFVLDATRHLSFQPNDQLAGINWESTSLSLCKPITHRKISKDFFQKGFRDLLLIEGISMHYDKSDSILHIRKDPLLAKECSRVVLQGNRLGRKTFRFQGEHSLLLHISDLEPVGIWFFK